MNFEKRTKKCGQLSESDVAQEIVLNGWVSNVRNLGGLIFIDLRDRYGLVQLVIEPENTPVLAERATNLRSEYVIWVKGTVRNRENPNPKMPTGLIEVLLSDYGLINKAELPPFEINDDIETSEEIRLQYRYLDLRRPILQQKFMVRNHVCQIMHQYYFENEFLEVETPVLMKSTPEGARDFLVPSRINKGKFYALPQSPQLYKQILMVSGFDKYMQIVKCFRDEDLRSDRQPEFTQVDVEMSFVDIDDILEMTEGVIQRVWKEVLAIDIERNFPRMTYHDAMSNYGSDKPDLRYDLRINTISDLVKDCSFGVFTDNINNGGIVAVINAKGCSHFSRKNIDGLTDLAKKYGAKGLAWMKYDNDQVNSPIAKFLNENETKGILEAANAENGDLLLFVSDKWTRTYTALGALRIEVAKQSGIFDKIKNNFNFSWVTEFPLFEYDEIEDRHVAMHHAFTSPMDEDIELLSTSPEKARAKAYDLVINGAEVGGGSIRIHDNKVQQKIFELMNMTDEDIENKFGFFTKSLIFGAPPHGGIALGLDRLVMTLCHTDNIRDVIAFPKTTSGISLMDGCPTSVDEKQLDELAIAVTKVAKI
jgi:aspartyl-tRNA synthetase